MAKNNITATAILVVSFVFILITVLLSFVLNVKSVKLPAVVQAEKINVPAQTDGYVDEIMISINQTVQANETILELENPQLELKISSLKEEKKYLEHLVNSAVNGEKLSLELNLINEELLRQENALEKISAEIRELEENLKIYSEFYKTSEKEFDSFRKLYGKNKISVSEYHKKSAEFMQAKNRYDSLSNGLAQKQKEKQFIREKIANLKYKKQLYEQSPDFLAADFRLQLAKVQENLKQALLEKDALKVKAPINGIIAKRNFAKGEFVGKGNSVAQIVSLDSLYLIAWGNSVLHRKVFPRQKVIIFSSDGTKLEGKINSVSPVVESSDFPTSAYQNENLINKIEIYPSDFNEAKKHLIAGEKIFVKILF